MRFLLVLAALATFNAGCADSSEPGHSDVTAEPLQASCGDGTVSAEEECDDGTLNSESLADACRLDCTAARCGDGVVDSNEECDGTEGCTDLCARDPICGDGIVDEGEECDHQGPDCTTECTVTGFCGDGVVGGAEECDDGNQDAGDGCDEECVEEVAVCGDGVIEGSEECDDGNLEPGDDCTDVCEVARCGDGRVRLGNEECDEGSANGEGGYTCNSLCQFPSCGDGIVDPEESCDPGAPDSPDCVLCGAVASEASLVNLLIDGRDVTMLQAGASGPVLGPVPSVGALAARPVLAGGNSVNLLLSDGTLIEGVETEFGMGPGDHYTFIVYGTRDQVEVRVIREVQTPPPNNEVRLRVMNGLANEVSTVCLQESAPEFESEFLLFLAVFGEMTLDLTRPPSVLDVRLSIHSGEPTYFEFALGESVVGEDNSIFVTGTSEAPVLIRTTTTGGMTIAEGTPVDPEVDPEG